MYCAFPGVGRSEHLRATFHTSLSHTTNKGCFCIKTFQILRLLQSLSFSSQGIEVRLREKGLSYVDGATEALFVEPEEGVRVDVEVEKTELEEVQITPPSWVCCTLHCCIHKI